MTEFPNLDAWVANRPRITALAVFVATFVLLLVTMDRDLNIFDEGIVLVDAMRTNAGAVIHRDYYSVYGPGAYWLVAGLFKLVGPSFIAARVYGMTVMAGIVALTTGALVGRVRLVFVGMATAASALLMVAYPQYLYPSYPCALLAFIGAVVLSAPGAVGRAPALLAAGVCAGLAAWFRYDAGFAILVAYVVALAVLMLDCRPRASLGNMARSIVLCGAGAGIVFLPGLIAYLAVAPVTDFWADIIDFSVRYYPRMRGMPFPRPRALLQYSYMGTFVPLVAAAAGVVEYWLRRHAVASERGTSCLVLFTALAAILFYKGLVRASTFGSILALLPALVVLALVAQSWWQRGIGGRIGAVAAMVISLVPAAYPAAAQALIESRDPDRVLGYAVVAGRAHAPAACDEPAALALARQNPDYRAVAHYLRLASAPDERIFVGLRHHDRVFVNAISLYFAAQRLPATHWHQFDPGLQTRADIQRAIVTELDRAQTHWVVRDASFDSVREPNDSSLSSGVFVLDRYLDARYRPIAAAGPVAIWLRRGVAALPLPADPAGACLPAPIPG